MKRAWVLLDTGSIGYIVRKEDCQAESDRSLAAGKRRGEYV
jgi:hypothetical protein